MFSFLQDIPVIPQPVNNIYALLNTFLLVAGPILVVWINTRNSKKTTDKVVQVTDRQTAEVKSDLSVANAVADVKMDKIHNVVNGRFEREKERVTILARQLESLGVTPAIRHTEEHPIVEITNGPSAS